MMTPRKSSKELNKQLIIEEAREQFAHTDYQLVSMRSIAKKLDCTHGAIYYHFENKAALFYAVIEGYFQHLNKKIEEIITSNEDQKESLQKLFIAFIKFGLDHQRPYELMFMTRNNEVDGLNHESANHCYQNFAHAIHTLTNHHVTMRDVYSIFVSLHGFISHYRGFAEGYKEAEDAALVHIEFIHKALRPF
ncbi:TetR/AcrR family transcriptional regulator [Alkalihalophilus pseudofirmus]|uniref:TetR/AcrR family transcriptional regulator n=1 Tax=Alkalihalophilus pseudofirmus TaxID=79885 RepID=UPI00259B6414|nr:TetR/AcrR family transcriptional regulator [Alkalihalophilus pseudofirmus]WEG18969.1 TetR/AcrR family transcriptional regulator [Alkalihalophilus pseudofirmus]